MRCEIRYFQHLDIPTLSVLSSAKYSPIAAREYTVILSYRMVLPYCFFTEYPRAQSHSSVIAVRRPRRPGCGSAVGNILRGWCRNRHHWGRIRPWRVVILCVSAWSRRPVSPLRCGTPSWYGLGTPRRDTFRAEYRKSVPTSMRCNRWTANNRSGTASWRISFRRAKPFPITMITVSIAFLLVIW